MDITPLLAEQSAKKNSIVVEKDIPIEVDVGLLCATDHNTIDREAYQTDKEDFLRSTARDGVQVLLTSLFSLPTQPSPDGPLGLLPPPTILLPRAKSLPKPKPPTKWERFAAAKGIQHKKREAKVWDEEKQDWVRRWGKGGKNKDVEEQWLTEVPASADADHDPAKIARVERKARVAKNEKQRVQNAERASRVNNVKDIDKALATTRQSTASMGRFDKKLEGEKKLRGVKRKFDSNETSTESERKQSLALISKLGNDQSRKKPRSEGSNIVNIRKAIRQTSSGRGSLALAHTGKKSGNKKDGRKRNTG